VNVTTNHVVGTPSVAPVVLDGVSVFYGEVVGLSRVDLTLDPGITGIVGPNGSGKTTLMRTLIGLIAPQEGTCRVLGRSPMDDASVRARLTFVPASESFYRGLTGRRNLEVAFMAQGRDRGASKELAARALDLVALTEHGDRSYGQYSRGMRQRLKLGLALAGKSEVVLLDEPFLGVDPPNRKALREHIAALGREGRTVLVSSHVLHEIEQLTELVGVLAHGRLLGFGKVHDILRKLRDDHPHRILLTVDDPRRFAAGLLEADLVQELRLVDDATLEFVTVRPEETYRTLARLVVESGIAVRRVETLDHTLEAVFTQVTAVGSRRL
jgi:ABC-2 type transport system ATP-binding protein